MYKLSLVRRSSCDVCRVKGLEAEDSGRGVGHRRGEVEDLGMMSGQNVEATLLSLRHPSVPTQHRLSLLAAFSSL